MGKKKSNPSPSSMEKKQKLESPPPLPVAAHKKGDKKKTIRDARFQSSQSDPRFQTMPKKERKVVIDSRFAPVLTDPSFTGSTAPVDKRGRRRKEKAVNPLTLHYVVQEEHHNEPLDHHVKDEEDAGRDADVSSSSDDSDKDDSDDDQCSVSSDIAHYLLADHVDTPMTEEETHRLAVVNLDWLNIKAVDLYVVINSCLPKGGQLLSVAIYPSEFGLKCMEVEATRGPSALLDVRDKQGEHGSDTDDDSDDDETHDEETDDEELRTYELNKLRYYYAVVVCDSSATANHIYKILDGTEFLSTSNVFDLRFIPDSMEFKHPPRDITTQAPTSYKEPDFQTRALQHSKVNLTWEEDEPDRKKKLRRKFNADKPEEEFEKEFEHYLASSGGSDSDGDDDKMLAIERLQSLCQPADDSDAAHSDENNMEITFSTGLEDLSKRILEKKDKKSETVWEAVLRKKTEKKKAWKKRSKYSSEDDSSDSDFHDVPDQPDDFFVDDEAIGDDAKIENAKTKDKSKKRGNSRQNGREPSPTINKEQEASRAELELLLADEQGADRGRKGYNLKTKKEKGKKWKKGNEMPVEDKSLDVSNDPRFSFLSADPLFALDPTDPQYKRSAVYLRQRSQKHDTSSKVDNGKAVEEAGDLSKRVNTQPPEVVLERNHDLVSVGDSSAKEKDDLSSTVRSLKRKLGTIKKASVRS